MEKLKQERTNKIRNPYDKTVYNIGCLGEGEYKSSINRERTPHYATWNAMLRRCYDVKLHKRKNTYIGCTVAPEWHNFQVFAKWYDENFYQIDDKKMCLDKDILFKGNKIYSADKCIFTPNNINNLFTKSNVRRGIYPIGVVRNTNIKTNMFFSECQDGKGNRTYLGSFSTPEEAFLVYKKYKEIGRAHV